MKTGLSSNRSIAGPLGLAGHNFLVLKDPSGKVVGELHGLATDKNGQPKIIGILPTDQLHFFRTMGDTIMMGISHK